MLRQSVISIGNFRGDEPSCQPSCLRLHIGGRTFLDVLIDEVARYDLFDEILLLTDDTSGLIEAGYHATVRGRSRLSVAIERECVGVGGALGRAWNLLNSRFLLLNANSFFDFNLLDLISRSADSLVHAALLAATKDDRHARVSLDGDIVSGLLAPGQGRTCPIVSGICVIDRRILAKIPRHPASLEQVFEKPIASGAVRGTAYHGYFTDIDFPDEFARAALELKERLTRPAVFFDRDGVLNHDAGYVFEASKFQWMERAREAVKLVNDAGYFAFVITNQSGVARGFYEESHVHALHRWMADELATIGAHVDAFEHCPDHPDAAVERYRRVSPRRKPGPGMITDLLERFPVAAANSILIGDQPTDLEAARAAGIQGLLFQTGNLEIFVREALKLP
ncbi:MAG: HAD-IIIA family hydrolase [Bradyrhizobium sp.]|uniref:HAD-IIIA family hydrolase n=1 Tax=Bradyrhizobium sp. TaxID=376 RepID=UPI0025C6DAEF|nr:HAD-IIIA family hydrolase [Bradyrhizobium sp.]MBI5261245.1 HAD-IIIA family hydrolase [Bradyrhizobium sp.]